MSLFFNITNFDTKVETIIEIKNTISSCTTHTLQEKIIKGFIEQM